MKNPFRIIESKISSRRQFEVVEGYQPTHALFYLKKGSFVIEIDGEKEEVGVGDCMILPDYIHFRRNVLNPIEFVYIKFAENPDCPYRLDIPYGKIAFRDKERFASSVSAIERSVGCDDPAAVGYREHLLTDILFQVHFERHTLGETLKTQYRDQLVLAAIDYIVENIGTKIAIEEVCRAIGTNSSTLNYKLRRETGMSCGQLIMSERMKKARHLLISSTYNITEIASRCGFENLYYFSNAFKKENGMSPSEFIHHYHA